MERERFWYFKSDSCIFYVFQIYTFSQAIEPLLFYYIFSFLFSYRDTKPIKLLQKVSTAHS